MIAGDTRLTDGQYGINTRYAPKVWDVGDNIVITANGYSADGDTLVKRISQKIEVLLIPATRFPSKADSSILYLGAAVMLFLVSDCSSLF